MTGVAQESREEPDDGRQVLYLSWADVDRMVKSIVDTNRRLSQQLNGGIPNPREPYGRGPSTIIAIARGGLIPAVMLSHYYKVDSFQTIRATHYGAGIAQRLPGVEQNRVVLRELYGDLRDVWVVDDIVDTGVTMSAVVETVRQQATALATGSPTRVSLVWRSVYIDGVEPDLFGQSLGSDAWVVFPWERDGVTNPRVPSPNWVRHQE